MRCTQKVRCNLAELAAPAVFLALFLQGIHADGQEPPAPNGVLDRENRAAKKNAAASADIVRRKPGEHVVAFNRDGTRHQYHSVREVRDPAQVRELFICSGRLVDEDLSLLSSASHLTALAVPGFWEGKPSLITDAALQKIADLPDLEYLSLCSNRITDEGLSQLKSLMKLTVLELRSSTIGDAGVAQLGALPELCSLTMRAPRITDEALGGLSTLTNLMTLDVCGTSVSGTGFLPDRCPPHLGSLYGNFTDAGLQVIGRTFACSVFLQCIGTAGHGVTDAGLAHLDDIRLLQTVLLHDTLATDTGIRRLRLFKEVTVVNGGRVPFFGADEGRVRGSGRTEKRGPTRKRARTRWHDLL